MEYNRRATDRAPPQVTLRYDFKSEVLTVGGLRYAAEVFRMIHAAPVGALFRLCLREDGVLTIESVNPPHIEAAPLPTANGGHITITVEPPSS